MITKHEAIQAWLDNPEGPLPPAVEVELERLGWFGDASDVPDLVEQQIEKAGGERTEAECDTWIE